MTAGGTCPAWDGPRADRVRTQHVHIYLPAVVSDNGRLGHGRILRPALDDVDRDLGNLRRAGAWGDESSAEVGETTGGL
jgi:hypothetical protein